MARLVNNNCASTAQSISSGTTNVGGGEGPLLGNPPNTILPASANTPGSTRPRRRLVESVTSILTNHCFRTDGGRVICQSTTPQVFSSATPSAPARNGSSIV